ncbi:hypothetical protein LOY38_21915 [Pseudomonas sp. B21-015]|uniref:hypothetical protein n=1 Tax=Pseudomonas sp. B21-015 TaxID=2895473 RepID=UPI00215E726E|nr:hypothetical protein [Pseudomonas sp. B21-015]UVM48997.1 hypothetical protein LOY38_21915 [Pseudomonas sp. B21-015]
MNSPVTNAAPASNGQIVVFPPDRGIGVLAVDRPFPPGYKPQGDGALGININMVHGDRDGLLVYILAYLNMAVGDHIKVYIETKNAPVTEFPVTDAHFDAEGNAKNIPFHISAKDMEARFLPLQPENKDFWFEVQRVSDNAEKSPPVPLFYKYPAPGEADTDGGKPFNQGLKLPVASESFVDQTVIDDGMFVTVPEYFNQSIGDVVVLAFGSLLLESTVTALGDVVFELTPEMLATLKPTNSLVVRWEVFDVVENSSGWSDALILSFKPGVVLLAAPIFAQADPDNVVHHDGLAGGAMTVLVTGVFAKDDLIELTLEGLTKGGAPVTHTYSRTLTAASRTVDFPVENERVRNLIGGSLHASYRLIKASKTQLSKPADVTITGTSQPLGLPIVEPLADNKLPVDTAMATVRVAEYWPLKKGATVEARWQTTDQDGIVALFIFRLIVTDPTQPVTFQVPAKYIAPYANTPLTVQCMITNPGEVQVFSEWLQLMIGEEAKIELLPPLLVKPAANPIDPLGDLPTVRVEFLAAIAQDRARLVERKAPVGSQPFPLTLLNKNKRANFLLNREFLVARQGTSLELFWNLNRDGKKVTSSESLALTLKPIAAEDSRFPTPGIEGATTELDVTTLLPTAQLTVAEWLGQASGQCVWLRYDGFDANGAAVSLELFKGEAHNGSSGFSCPAQVDWLSALGHGTVLTISFKVNFNQKANFTTAVSFPKRTYTVKAVELVQPTIELVKTSKGDVIPDKGNTFESNLNVSGTASKNLTVELFVQGNSKGVWPVDGMGKWQTSPLSFSEGDNTLIAKAKYGTEPESEKRNFIIKPTLKDELTTFRSGTFEGWVRGPITDPRDLRIISHQGRNVLFNNTYSSLAGIFLKKSFPNFKIGQRYQFSIEAIRIDVGGGNVAPVISLSTSQGPLTGTSALTINWTALSGVFTAQTNSLELYINTHQATHVSNDYAVVNLRIRAI